MDNLLQLVRRPDFIDYLAPDGAEIRLLKDGSAGGLCECTLGPGAITTPVVHRVVEEIWYVLSGSGEIWRDAGHRQPMILRAGDSLMIPVGTEFQFRAGNGEPLVMLLATVPPWSRELDAGGPDTGRGYWKPRTPSAEWRIQGDWWQLNARDDGRVQLARMRIARIAPLRYLIEGQSWTDGWVERADFKSSNAEFLPQERLMRYQWSGFRGDDPYSGTGEILFARGDDIDNAQGYYDLRVGSGIEDAVRINAVYSRMDPAEDLSDLMTDDSSFERVFRKHFVGHANQGATKAG